MARQPIKQRPAERDTVSQEASHVYGGRSYVAPDDHPAITPHPDWTSGLKQSIRSAGRIAGVVPADTTGIGKKIATSKSINAGYRTIKQIMGR